VQRHLHGMLPVHGKSEVSRVSRGSRKSARELEGLRSENRRMGKIRRRVYGTRYGGRLFLPKCTSGQKRSPELLP
jgi:hypothetical protein